MKMDIARKEEYGESPISSFTKYVKEIADKKCFVCGGSGFVLQGWGICRCVPKDKLVKFGYLQYGWLCK